MGLGPKPRSRTVRLIEAPTMARVLDRQQAFSDLKRNDTVRLEFPLDEAGKGTRGGVVRVGVDTLPGEVVWTLPLRAELAQ